MSDKVPVDIGRLAQAAQRARLALRFPRQKRFDIVRQFVGANYSEEGSDKIVPLNLLAQYQEIVGNKLIADSPRFMLSTWNRQAKPAVSTMEQWGNKEVEKINLANTLETCVNDALVWAGICKVALATPSDAAMSGWGLSAGEPCAWPIDLDDFVYDVHARDFSEVSFIGHRYRAPLAVVKQSKHFSKQRKDLNVSDDQIYNLEGDERISLIGRTTLAGQEELEDMVDLWEFYLPRHKLIITLHDDNLTGAAEGEFGRDKNYGKALRIQKWIGPDCGPYHILGFGKVPGNPAPKAPMQDLYDMHMHVNKNLRKLMVQAENQKENVFVSGGADADGNRLITANDGECVRVDNPERLQQVKWRGPDQANFQFFLATKELFSWKAGNLDIMGGLSPQAKTAHQDEMLNQNSTATITRMQQRTVDFTSSVIGALCWYWHHHPTKVMKSEYAIPGLPNMSITRELHPNHPSVPFGKMARSHDWDDVELKVDPYSMQHKTPQQRVQTITQVITQIYMPMAQIAQQQGITLDLNAFFSKVGKWMDEPDLAEILTVQEPPSEDVGGGTKADGAGPQPAQTERTYTRRSMGGTPAGQQKDLMQQLAQGMGKTNGTPQDVG